MKNNNEASNMSNRISNQSKLLILVISIVILILGAVIYISLTENKDNPINDTERELNKDYSNEEQVNSSDPTSQTSRRLLIRFVERMVETVATDYATELVLGNEPNNCFNISDIVEEGMNSYTTLKDLEISGYILIEVEEENPTYKVFISSMTGNLNGVKSSELSLMNIVSGPIYLYESGCPI